MTAPTHTCYTLAAALVGEPSEALLLASGTSGMATHGTVTVVVEGVISRVMVAATHPQWVSVRCTAAAIFKVVITCPSGVTIVVTDL